MNLKEPRSAAGYQRSLPETAGAPAAPAIFPRGADIDDIVRVCADEWGVDPRLIRSARRPGHVIEPRFAVFFLACELRPDLTLPQIGRALLRDHSTIIYGREQAERMIATRKDFAAAIAYCRARLAQCDIPPPTRARARKWDTRAVTEVAELAKQGKTDAEIGERFACSARTIQKIRAQAGVLHGPTGNWTAENDAELRRLADEGFDLFAIASRLSRTREGVRSRAARLGVKVLASQGERNPLSAGAVKKADKAFAALMSGRRYDDEPRSVAAVSMGRYLPPPTYVAARSALG